MGGLKRDEENESFFEGIGLDLAEFSMNLFGLYDPSKRKEENDQAQAQVVQMWRQLQYKGAQQGVMPIHAMCDEDLEESVILTAADMPSKVAIVTKFTDLSSRYTTGMGGDGKAAPTVTGKIMFILLIPRLNDERVEVTEKLLQPFFYMWDERPFYVGLEDTKPHPTSRFGVQKGSGYAPAFMSRCLTELRQHIAAETSRETARFADQAAAKWDDLELALKPSLWQQYVDPALSEVKRVLESEDQIGLVMAGGGLAVVAVALAANSGRKSSHSRLR